MLMFHDHVHAKFLIRFHALMFLFIIYHLISYFILFSLPCTYYLVTYTNNSYPSVLLLLLMHFTTLYYLFFSPFHCNLFESIPLPPCISFLAFLTLITFRLVISLCYLHIPTCKTSWKAIPSHLISNFFLFEIS